MSSALSTGKVNAVVAAVAALVLGLAGLSVQHSHATSTGTVGEVTPPSLLQQPNGPVAYFVGDSYTEGAESGGRGKENYSYLVARDLGWVGFNMGRSGTGYVAGQDVGYNFGSAKRLAQFRTQWRPDIIFVVNGVNDLYSPDSLIQPAVRETLRDIKALEPQADLVVIGYIPPGETPANYLSAERELNAAALDGGALFWDPVAEGWFADHPELIGSDHFHPTNAGHRYLAQIILQHIRAAGLDRIRRGAPDRVPT